MSVQLQAQRAVHTTFLRQTKDHRSLQELKVRGFSLSVLQSPFGVRKAMCNRKTEVLKVRFLFPAAPKGLKRTIAETRLSASLANEKALLAERVWGLVRPVVVLTFIIRTGSMSRNFGRERGQLVSQLVLSIVGTFWLGGGGGLPPGLSRKAVSLYAFMFYVWIIAPSPGLGLFCCRWIGLSFVLVFFAKFGWEDAAMWGSRFHSTELHVQVPHSSMVPEKGCAEMFQVTVSDKRAGSTWRFHAERFKGSIWRFRVPYLASNKGSRQRLYIKVQRFQIEFRYLDERFEIQRCLARFAYLQVVKFTAAVRFL